MAIPDSLGWYEIPNTTFQTIEYDPGAHGVVEDYSGGILDTTRNRLVLWGGGHGGYGCNELYALNLGPLTIQRLNNPCCSGQIYDEICPGSSPPQPEIRHTYDMLAYIETADRMFTSSGQWNGPQSEWTFDFQDLTWHEMFAANRPSGWYGLEGVAGYDPVTDKVFYEDVYTGFHAYTYSTNSWQHLGSITDYVGYGNGGFAIDLSRRRAWTIGGGTCAFYSLTGTPNYNRQSVSTTGDTNIINVGNPGVAYDADTTHIVCWGGGDTVYELNPDTLVWTAHTYTGGPGAQRGNGTHGRWRYSQPLGVFVLVNAWEQNCYAFRLTSQTPDTEAPSDPTNLAANAVSPTQIDLTWTASTDNVGVAHYYIERCFGSGCTNWAQVATATTNSYSNTGLTPATLYRYRVRADDAAGNFSGYSSIAEDTTDTADTTPPTDPANLSASVQSYNQINLRWDASTDAVGVASYRVERCAGTGCTGFVEIAAPTTNSYNDIGLAQNTVYRYRLRAVDAAENFSGYSNIASATTTSSGVLQVGSTKTYATLAAAIAVAIDGDVIECDPEIYANDSCTITQNNITVRGIGGYAHFKWDTGDYRTSTNYIPNGQGIVKMLGSGMLENLEFSGALVEDGNGAGIRYFGGNVTIRRCYCHHNQNGILGESNAVGPTLIIEYSTFFENGYFDGTYYSHNCYIGRMRQLIFRYNASLDPLDGHCFKSRAEVNLVLYNYFSTKNNSGSFECEFPNGHQAVVIGNILEQGDGSDNSTILSYGAEGLTTYPDVVHELHVVNNTFYNWRTAGCIYIQAVQTPAVLRAVNNARSNNGTWRSGTGTSLIESNNVALDDAAWVDINNGDFHLVQGGAAIDAGTDPGSITVLAASYSLTPQYEYVSAADKKSRNIDSTLDTGAFEFGGNPRVRRVVTFRRPGS